MRLNSILCCVQYMVVYQLLVSLAVNVTFYMDGSWLSVPQVACNYDITTVCCHFHPAIATLHEQAMMSEKDCTATDSALDAEDAACERFRCSA